MRDYIELIEDSLYEETFELLEKNASSLTDMIEQKRYVRSIFGGLFEEDFFVSVLKEKKWGLLANAMSHALDRPFFSEMKNKLDIVIDTEKAEKLVSILILENKIDAAKTFLPYAGKDLSHYVGTVDGIINSNSLDALKFVCENFDNIHFNFDELLAKSCNMKTDAIKMLIDDFGFDLNTQSRLSNNLLMGMIKSNNLKNFEWVNRNYGDKLNYNNEKIYEYIEKNTLTEFYGVMLLNPYLKQVSLEKIGNYLFNGKNIENLYQTDIYEKFFVHKNFNDQSFTLGQGYFLYGLLSKMGMAAKRDGNDVARYYLRILDTYLNTLASDSIPDSPEFHIVGAAVHVAKIGECQSTTEACTLVMHRFGKYINKPNPSGVLPISQVEKDSALFRILVNNGAVPPEPEPTFWSSVLNIFKGKKEATIPSQEIDKPYQSGGKFSIPVIRVKMRNDFRAMRQYLAGESCDSTIKIKCENMFLKADKLSAVMEKNNLTSFTDELHFLSENFSNYLMQSLKAYTDLEFTTRNLDGEEEAAKKIENAKRICLNHVDLLTEQLDLITNNISNGLSDGAMSQLKVRSKFLEERFNQSIDDKEEQKENEVVQVLVNKKQ